MKLFAIDQSLTESGVCVLNTLTKDMRIYTIKIKKLKGVERLRAIQNQIETEILMNFPDFAIMEGYSYGSIGRTFELGELGGMIKMLFEKYKIAYYIAPPSEWKKAILGKGNGNANKDKVILEVYKKYEIMFKNDNKCDAFCLCKYLEQMVNNDENTDNKSKFGKPETKI